VVQLVGLSHSLALVVQVVAHLRWQNMRRGQCFSLRGQAPAGSSVLPQGLKELDPAEKHSYLLVRQRMLPGKLRVHRVKMRHKRLNLLLLEIALTRWFGLVCLIQSALKGRRHVGTTLACAVCAVLSRVMMCSDAGFDVRVSYLGLLPPPRALAHGRLHGNLERTIADRERVGRRVVLRP